MAISSELEQLLARWIPRQSWFPKLAADFGMDPDITPMSVARAFTFTAEELGGFSGLVTVISVGDGPTLRRLNIPLSLRGTEDIHLRHALIGTVDDLALGRVFVYDGAADPIFVNLLADAITKRKVFDGGQLSTESLRHSRDRSTLASTGRTRETVPASTSATVSSSADDGDPSAEAVPPKPATAPPSSEVKDEIDVPIRPIEVADSGAHKSTVIIHDEYEPVELSFFRVLENGMPSSLTIPVLLTEAGSRSVPEVIGWSSGRWYDMFEVTEMEAPMALLSQADVEAEPAWREAVDIVCAVDSGSIGGYNAHAAEMGRRIGELHSDMAAEFGIVEGAGAPTKQFVDKWAERVDWALGRAPLALDSLVPELKQHRNKLRSLDSIGTLQKIHGELTLDHVVSSPSEGYQVVKFTDSSNSDPKPVAIDLVALLRSVDYAAGFARLQRTEALENEDGGLVVNGFGNDPAALRTIYDSPEYLWASQVQNSLLSGYSRARGESIGLGDPVLRAALIDRLLVEVVTELRNRPNWLSVPLATLTLILKGKPARGSDDPTEAELSVPATDAGAGGVGAGGDSDRGDGIADGSDVGAGANAGAGRTAGDGDRVGAVDADSGSSETGSDAADADSGGSDTKSDASDPDSEASGSDDKSGAEADGGAVKVDGAGDDAVATSGDSSRGAAFVAGAAGVVGAAGVAGAVAANDGDDASADTEPAGDADGKDADSGDRADFEDDADSIDSAHSGDHVAERADVVGDKADTSSASVADADVEAADAESDAESTGTENGDGAESDAGDAADGDGTTTRGNDSSVTRDGDSQDVLVDAVSAESVEPRSDEIAEMDPEADAAGFVEPSVEAPSEVTETESKSPKTRGVSVNGSDKNTREGVTTSARGTTVTRTLFVSETTSTGGEGTTTSASSAVAGDVRITGGAVVEDTYVDAVTTETVERVDDGVPEVDLGVHDLAEVDVEALDESKGDSDKDSSDDIADVDAPGEHSEAGADTQTTDADPADETTDTDAPGETIDVEGSAAVTGGDAPPIVEDERAPKSARMPDAPPMPSEPPEVASAPLPDAPAVAEQGASERATGENRTSALNGPDAPAMTKTPADEDELADEEEAEFVPSRVPATFAARGATSADADSTGRSPHEQHKHDGGPAREIPGAKKNKKGKNKH
ncbi:maltokinase N-terminal cap-like domain-containing protein [Brevibacterium metallidurans]|uniref:Maltokinase N-terminal cap domain-containing protein n=1 Tax=Brevibacterium metallidurans TaxID=1482676 RepID=A0ABP3C707_9MICO